MILFQENNRLPKRIILRRKKDIDEVFHHSQRWFGSYVNIYYQFTEGDPGVAFFVKKKIGNAVIRNRSKRLLREFYRTHKKFFSNLKLIFIIKKAIPNLKAVQEELELFIKHEKNSDLAH